MAVTPFVERACGRRSVDRREGLKTFSAIIIEVLATDVNETS